MVEFLREGMSQAPIALGLLIGFTIGTPFLIVAEIRERKRRKAWRAELNQISAKKTAAHADWEADRAAWTARHSAPEEDA